MSSEDELDLVVVGAGLAGLACAFEAAGAGLQVAVCERGDHPGAKNLSGGRLYLEPVRELCGELLEGAPFERRVVSESLVVCDRDASMTMRVDTTAGEGPPPSVTVLRSPLDQFLGDRCMERGAFVMGEQRVDRLLLDEGAVVGVQVGTEELRSRMVVATDGVLSFVAQEAGLRARPGPGELGVGVKEIITLDPAVIETRFNVGPGEGAARLYMGQVTDGLPGGGFIYTNRESLSVGLVVGMEPLSAWGGEEKLWELLEHFKARSDVAPLLEGGATVEYGAHLVPEGGFDSVGELGRPGLLLAGDAAGLVLNTGLTLRGMDLALASGVLAARSVVEACKGGNPRTPACVQHYRQSLEESFVLRQLRAHRRAPELLQRERLFQHYPPEVVRWAQALFAVDGEGNSRSVGRAMRALRQDVVGWAGIKDLWRILRT